MHFCEGALRGVAKPNFGVPTPSLQVASDRCRSCSSTAAERTHGMVTAASRNWQIQRAADLCTRQIAD
jgi:hypothetical protein